MEYLAVPPKQRLRWIIKDQLPALPAPTRPARELYNPLQCPCCKKDTMQTILQFTRRGPPVDWKQLAIIFLNVSCKKNAADAVWESDAPEEKD